MSREGGNISLYFFFFLYYGSLLFTSGLQTIFPDLSVTCYRRVQSRICRNLSEKSHIRVIFSAVLDLNLMMISHSRTFTEDKTKCCTVHSFYFGKDSPSETVTHFWNCKDLIYIFSLAPKQLEYVHLFNKYLLK